MGMTANIIKPNTTKWERVHCPCCGNPAEMRVVFDQYGSASREYRRPRQNEPEPPPAKDGQRA